MPPGRHEPYYPACPGLTSAPAAAQTYDRQAEPYETPTYTFVVEGNAQVWDDDSGSDWVQSPEWKATVSVGSWVGGSDRAGLDSAWLAVSKTGAMPLPSGPYGHTGKVISGIGYHVSKDPRYVCLDSREAAYTFGTVTFEDVTEFPEPPVGYMRPVYPTTFEVEDVSAGTRQGGDT